MAGTFGMVVGRGHFPVLVGGCGQGADCRVLVVSTRVLGRDGFCRQEMNGGDGDESDPKTLRRVVGAVGSSRPYPSSMSSSSSTFNQIKMGPRALLTGHFFYFLFLFFGGTFFFCENTFFKKKNVSLSVSVSLFVHTLWVFRGLVYSTNVR